VDVLIPGEWLGYVAGGLTTASFLPQVMRVIKIRSAHEISLFFNLLFLIGAAVWLAYGIYFNHLPLILWNSITFLLVASLLYAKLKYGR